MKTWLIAFVLVTGCSTVCRVDTVRKCYTPTVCTDMEVTRCPWERGYYQ
jgi:hypothetical protein